jgi:carbonic anhydrase
VSAEPARKLAVVTCMDARIDVYRLLGLELGDAHVIRNAGGLVTDDALRSLALSQSLLGTRDVMVIQHTGCGLQGDEDEMRARVVEATGAEPPLPLGAFADVEESVRRQLETLRSTPYLVEGRTARGYVYDIESGDLREVT